MKGWISLHRKILDNPILTRSRTYSRFEAFIFMLLSANHKENKVIIGNQIVKVKKGSFISSQKKLMLIFNWGSTKLRAFLTMLENDKMIKLNINKVSTQISILNYDTYQSNGTQTEHKQNTSRTQTETNNKANKVNNDNNIKIRESEFINKVLAEGIKRTPIVDPDTLKEFYNYWTEANLSGKKMRFEMEKTFSISRRLDTWINNKNKWNIEKKSDFIPNDYNLDSTGYNRYGFCAKCGETVFGTFKYIHTEDSKCCNQKILPRKK